MGTILTPPLPPPFFFNDNISYFVQLAQAPLIIIWFDPDGHRSVDATWLLRAIAVHWHH